MPRPYKFESCRDKLPKKIQNRDLYYLRLALTEQQLHTSLDEFRMCDKFEDDRCAVSRPQQVLRMVDGNNANCLPDRLYSIAIDG